MSPHNIEKFNNIVTAAILSLLLVAAVIFVYKIGFENLPAKNNGAGAFKPLAVDSAPEENSAPSGLSGLEEKVIPSEGIELPVIWGDLGKKMVGAGVIDKNKLEDAYAQKGELSEADRKMIYGEGNGKIVINSRNSGLILNLLWALGLGNKNKILETGPMVDPQYGGAGNFASTGGWTISAGNAMNYYSKSQFVVLTAGQQQLVEKVSKNIYRPCCGNSTYFPDCNHGMAMLGFLELAASQGFGENALYQMALVLNSYWFPDNYLTIAQYLQNEGVDWDKANSREILGQNFSSASGYQKIMSQTRPKSNGGGGSCGV